MSTRGRKPEPLFLRVPASVSVSCQALIRTRIRVLSPQRSKRQRSAARRQLPISGLRTLAGSGRAKTGRRRL